MTVKLRGDDLDQGHDLWLGQDRGCGDHGWDDDRHGHRAAGKPPPADSGRIFHLGPPSTDDLNISRRTSGG